MKQGTKINVNNVRVYISAECGSDHHLMKAKLIKPLTGKSKHQQNQIQTNNEIADMGIPQYTIES